MFKSSFVAASLLGALLVTGCASVPMASKSADSAAKAYKADPGKANVYIYRNETFGAALKMPVAIDNAPAGETASKTYIFHQLSPGTHTITSQDKSTLSLDAKSGSNYFVWQEVKMGLVSGGSELHLVDEAKGKAGVAECSLVQ
jgi:PBP1b-binding outer membrane lipoprotein LpoB